MELVIEVSYVGSRTKEAQSQFNGINEPSLAFRNLCDPTKGGDPRICQAQVPNPFKNVSGFEGTNLYTADLYLAQRSEPAVPAVRRYQRERSKRWPPVV